MNMENRHTPQGKLKPADGQANLGIGKISNMIAPIISREGITASLLMAERLIKFCGIGAWDDLSDPKALHEAKFLKLNCDKAHAELDW